MLGSALRSWTIRSFAAVLASSSYAFIPRTTKMPGRGLEMRYPRAHEIEHIAVDAVAPGKAADSADRLVVDVRYKARSRIEDSVRFSSARAKKPSGNPSCAGCDAHASSQGGEGLVEDPRGPHNGLRQRWVGLVIATNVNRGSLHRDQLGDDRLLLFSQGLRDSGEGVRQLGVDGLLASSCAQ